MSDWLVAIILGIVEGITEFIPVSSTGHLLLAEHLLKVRESDLFNIVIQAGAVMAVLPLFPQRLHKFVFAWREKETRDYLLKILVAFVITGAVGFVLDRKGLKLQDNPLPIAWALLIGGIGFVGVEWFMRGRKFRDEITWWVALAVAIGQLAAAVYPGTSRSGATILFSLMLGVNRPAATEFSFLVGIPTMLAASGLKIFQAFHHHTGETAQEHWGLVALGFVVAAVVSFFAVKWLLRYVQTHTFTVFGWYRIGLALVIFLALRP